MCLAAGMTGHFSKPVSKSILTKLDSLLVLSRANRAASAAAASFRSGDALQWGTAPNEKRSTSSRKRVVRVTDSVSSSGPRSAALLAPALLADS
jgi:hypothetical protein